MDAGFCEYPLNTLFPNYQYDPFSNNWIIGELQLLATIQNLH